MEHDGLFFYPIYANRRIIVESAVTFRAIMLGLFGAVDNFAAQT